MVANLRHNKRMLLYEVLFVIYQALPEHCLLVVGSVLAKLGK